MEKKKKEKEEEEKNPEKTGVEPGLQSVGLSLLSCIHYHTRTHNNGFSQAHVEK